MADRDLKVKYGAVLATMAADKAIKTLFDERACMTFYLFSRLIGLNTTNRPAQQLLLAVTDHAAVGGIDRHDRGLFITDQHAILGDGAEDPELKLLHLQPLLTFLTLNLPGRTQGKQLHQLYGQPHLRLCKGRAVHDQQITERSAISSIQRHTKVTGDPELPQQFIIRKKLGHPFREVAGLPTDHPFTGSTDQGVGNIVNELTIGTDSQCADLAVISGQPTDDGITDPEGGGKCHDQCAVVSIAKDGGGPGQDLLKQIGQILSVGIWV